MAGKLKLKARIEMHQAIAGRARTTTNVDRQIMTDRRQPKPMLVVPTPERLSKMIHGATVDSKTRATRQVDTFDGYRDYLHHVTAWLWYLRMEMLVAKASAAGTGSYGSSPGGTAFASRLGGMNPEASSAQSTLKKIRAVVADEFKVVLALMSDTLIDHSTGRPIAPHEFAAAQLVANLGREVRDKTSLTWWARGVVLMTGARLYELMVNERAMTRSTPPSLPTIKRTR